MTKIVPKEDVGEVASWEAPDVADTAAESLEGVDDTGAHHVTVGKLQALQEAAYREAFEQGRQEGLAAGRVEIEEQAAHLQKLMEALSRPFEDLDDQVDRDLLSLAFVMARQLVRRELKIDPGQVIGVVREAMAILPVASRDVALHLHPEDAKLVRDVMQASEADRAWTISEDPVLSRGSCRVTTATSQVDARLESRLGAIVSAVLGDERGTRNNDDEGR